MALEILGRIRVHPAGYGFVERDDGDADVFIPARYRGAALDGDRVKISTWLGYKGTEGRVDEVTERGRARITGILRKQGKHMVIEPDDPRIPGGMVNIDGGPGAAREGQCVVAQITRYPENPDEGLSARVIRVLGDPDDPTTEVLKVVSAAEIPDEFPDDVLKAAERVPTELGPADLADRSDLRDRAFLTIDPETARDFDDAICIEPREGGGVTAWVAVADVTHYVRAGSALDREARVRGCSVYLPNRAIPMLPHELSAGICSLLPEVDRCASVVRLEISHGGDIESSRITSAVIRSRARLDYGGVAAALEGDFRGTRARYKDWLPELTLMAKIAVKLRAKRAARGALDLDLPEAKVLLDEDDPKRVRDVVRSKPTEAVRNAYQLVESFMLAANEAVAQFFRERGLDTVWRVHDIPDPERVQALTDVAEAFGIEFDPESAKSPKAMRDFLDQVKGKPFERALSFQALRALKQAQYDVVNVGHYGLASAEYLHFTSPIRRYPDLMVHRLLKHQLHKEGLPSGAIPQPAPPDRAHLSEICRQSSESERRASSAEREVTDMYRAYLMRDRVGDELEGIISAIANFGIFVEINEPFVEGLIRVENLTDDSYKFDEAKQQMVGKRSGRAFSLGEPITVRLDSVSVQRRRLELSIAGSPPARSGPVEKGDLRRTKVGARKGVPAASDKRGKARDVQRRDGDRRGGGGGGGGGGKADPPRRRRKR